MEAFLKKQALVGTIQGNRVKNLKHMGVTLKRKLLVIKREERGLKHCI